MLYVALAGALVLCAVAAGLLAAQNRELHRMAQTLDWMATQQTNTGLRSMAPGGQARQLAAAVNRVLASRQQALLREQAATRKLRENIVNISHDLRTPLMSISAAATVLKRQPDTDRVAVLADRVLSSSQRMGRMIEDLLDVTRIRHAGGLALQLGRADMQSIVQRTLDEVQTSFPDRNIESVLQGDMAGVWDSERLCQVATNIVGNAIHHGAPDQPVRVAVDGTQASVVTVAVSNGGTIAPELLPHLFDPFRGRDRAPGRDQGLGLGLFIAHQVVRAHGGRIDVHSQDGTTRFVVELPRVSPAAEKWSNT